MQFNEAGKKAIYVNRLMSVKIEGLNEEQSEKVLQPIFEHAAKPELVYCHKWKADDLLMWDNRNSMHARKDFPSDQRRLIWPHADPWDAPQ